MGETEDIYHFNDGGIIRNMTPEAYIEYNRILSEAMYAKPVTMVVRRKGWFDTDDASIMQDGEIWLEGKAYYDAIFINGLDEHAIEIAIESAKEYLKLY